MIFESCLGCPCYDFRHPPSSFDHAHECVYLYNRHAPGGIDIVITVYTYSITDWGDPHQLQLIVW